MSMVIRGITERIYLGRGRVNHDMPLRFLHLELGYNQSEMVVRHVEIVLKLGKVVFILMVVWTSTMISMLY